MSASSGSSNSSRKLFNLLLFLIVIALLFGAVITLWAMSGSPNAGNQNNSSTAPAHPNDTRYGTATTMSIGGITRTSLLKSLDLLRTGNDTASWFQSNPQWRLFQAQADYVDCTGLSKQWSMIFRSANSSLIAYVDNGTSFLIQVEEADSGDLPLSSGQVLQDSTYIIGNATSTMGIGDDTNATPFGLVFRDDDDDGIYRLSYNNPADISLSFAYYYNARSGELIEDTA